MTGHVLDIGYYWSERVSVCQARANSRELSVVLLIYGHSVAFSTTRGVMKLGPLGKTVLAELDSHQLRHPLTSIEV